MKIPLNHCANILTHIRPIEHPTLHRAEEISTKLEQLIATCGLKIGDCIGTKEALRRRFQVSPGTMNEAVRILECHGTVRTRRGLNGGLFVASIPIEIAMRQVIDEVEPASILREQCRVISKQLEPLLVAEATKGAHAESVTELNSLIDEMIRFRANSLDILRRWRCVYLKIVDMGSNRLLSAIYAPLLDVLEQQNRTTCASELVADCRTIVDQITVGAKVREPKLQR